MKRAFLLSLTALLIAVADGLARWASIPLNDLLKKTDLIVVARLSGVRETTKKNFDYGSASLTVTESIRGTVKIGDKLRLEWSNPNDIICPRVEHAPYDGQTMIWLLQTSTNDAVRADHPDRVIPTSRRGEVDKLLKK